MFVKHKIRVSSNQMVPGENKCLFSLKANAFSNSATTDQGSLMDQIDGPLPPGKQHAQVTGPAVVHGYSVRLFTDFFGILMQGVSLSDDEVTVMDKDNYRTHTFGIQHASSDGTDGVSRREQRKDNAIKNVKYCMGYRYQPSRTTISTLLGISGLGMSNEEYASSFPKGLKIGTTKLDKKFTRKSMKHVGRGNYQMRKKSGFVLLPNTDTEFFSITLKNGQHSTSEANDTTDGWYFADITVWLSYDNS